MRITKVFAIAGLDGRTIGSKSLIGFSSGWTLIIKRQMLSSTFKTLSSFGTSVTEHRISCHRKYLSRWLQLIKPSAMKQILITLTLSFFYFTSPSQILQDTTNRNSDTLSKVINTSIADIESFKKEVKNEIDSLKKANSIDTTNANKLDKRISSLENQVNVLNKIDSIQKSAKSNLLQKRYEVAVNTILPKIIAGTVYVKGLSKFALIEQKINLAVSPWQDKDLRDGWDKLKDFTPFFGLAGASVPLLSNNQNTKGALITGLSAMIIPQIISWIGKSSGKKTAAKKIQEKVEFLTISRNAYDDLYQRKLELRNIFVKDSTFLVQLKAFDVEISLSTLTDSLKSLRIFKVQDYLNNFTEIQNQIPQYLSWTKNIISKYKSSEEIYNQIKDIENEIDDFIKGYSEDFNTIAGIAIENRRTLFASE